MPWKNISRKKYLVVLGVILLLVAFATIGTYEICRRTKDRLVKIYFSRQSVLNIDRRGEAISLQPNRSGFYADYVITPPAEFSRRLVQKEDKYFYWHPGVNPLSMIRAAVKLIFKKPHPASSTITQQLVKILYGQEAERTGRNKLRELFSALALDLALPKNEILAMYVNSIFFGNNTQGIKTASRLYFDADPDALTRPQIASLLATVSNPSNLNPYSGSNRVEARKILSRLKISGPDDKFAAIDQKSAKKNFQTFYNNDAAFELSSFRPETPSGRLTVDRALTLKLRQILKGTLQSLIAKDATDGAIVVIKLPENELLAIVGSPDPSIDSYGYRINMAVKPRAVGSAFKPFIYLKGFARDLRPYTLIDDQEYKYNIGTGFAFYPKNYDYKYNGRVTLHYALANSLNVPAVKVLGYVGLENFYAFLENDLEFKPVQPLANYQLGIALGELEMDLLTLSYYFTIFPGQGKLLPLVIADDRTPLVLDDAHNFNQNKTISPPEYIELVNRILSDRLTGVAQFGVKSSLNLPIANYAVKTGTSREYVDSWTIGFTPDFLVGVWVGNSDSSPMDSVSGQKGAGDIWQAAMNLLIDSEYDKKSPFPSALVKTFSSDGSDDYGLVSDDFNAHRDLLVRTGLILTPHSGDRFLLEPDMSIPLTAADPVDWYIDDKFFARAEKTYFSPITAGAYRVRAEQDGKKEEITLYISEEE